VAPPELVDAISAELIEAVASAGDMGFDVAGLDERERAVLDTLEGVDVEAGRARPKGVSDPLADHPYVATVLTGGFAPPPPDDVDRGELRELIRRGDLVERDGIVFHPDAIEGAARIAAGLLAASPDGFTVSELRDALGVTRKFALPLAAELDARGMTRRRGDLRIAGPRLPDP